MISMAGKAIRRWWALFALPTFAAFIIGFLVPFIMRLLKLLRIHHRYRR